MSQFAVLSNEIKKMISEKLIRRRLLRFNTWTYSPLSGRGFPGIRVIEYTADNTTDNNKSITTVRPLACCDTKGIALTGGHVQVARLAFFE